MLRQEGAVPCTLLLKRYKSSYSAIEEIKETRRMGISPGNVHKLDQERPGPSTLTTQARAEVSKIKKPIRDERSKDKVTTP